MEHPLAADGIDVGVAGGVLLLLGGAGVLLTAIVLERNRRRGRLLQPKWWHAWLGLYGVGSLAAGVAQLDGNLTWLHLSGAALICVAAVGSTVTLVRHHWARRAEPGRRDTAGR